MTRGSRTRPRDAATGADRQPVRLCVACRSRRPQADLLRLTVQREVLVVDGASRAPGRGAYLCREPACLRHAGARGGSVLRRALRRGSDLVVTPVLEGLHAQLGPDPSARAANGAMTPSGVNSRE